MSSHCDVFMGGCVTNTSL